MSQGIRNCASHAGGSERLIAHAIFPKHPSMALMNGAMAVAIVLGVALFWGVEMSG